MVWNVHTDRFRFSRCWALSPEGTASAVVGSGLGMSSIPLARTGRASRPILGFYANFAGGTDSASLVAWTAESGTGNG